jgi:tetratricopeptide (TPR) repeat protein
MTIVERVPAPSRPAKTSSRRRAEAAGRRAQPAGGRAHPGSEPAAQQAAQPAQLGGRPSARANGRGGARADAVAAPITRERAATRRPAARTGSLLAVDKEASEPVVTAKLADATRAYSADRYHDALRMLRKLSSMAPTSASVKELLGLTLYRLGKWPLALRELEAHHQLSGSYDQFPVIADCYRALRRYDEAEATWTELRQASPSPEVVAEGRLVAAGSLADQGDLRGAVKLLEGTLRRSKPKGFHLRQWYALADLYERAGELPRARDLFAQIAAADPDAYDVKQRLIALD